MFYVPTASVSDWDLSAKAPTFDCLLIHFAMVSYSSCYRWRPHQRTILYGSFRLHPGGPMGEGLTAMHSLTICSPRPGSRAELSILVPCFFLHEGHWESGLSAKTNSPWKILSSPKESLGHTNPSDTEMCRFITS